MKSLFVVVIATNIVFAVASRTRSLRTSASTSLTQKKHIHDWAQQNLAGKDAINLESFLKSLDSSEANILNQLLRATQSGKQIPADQKTQLDQLIDNMLTATDQSHRNDVRTLNTAYTAFSQCQGTVTAEESQIESLRSEYDSKVTQHTSLRNEEDAALTAKTQCEDEMKRKEAEVERTRTVYHNALKKPACAVCDPPADSAPESQREQWWESQKACFDTGSATLKAAKDAYEQAVLDKSNQDCTTVVSTYVTKKSDADVTLQAVESDSCAAAKLQSATCTTLKECHDAAEQSYASTTEAVKTQIENRKVQWRGSTRLKCIVGAMETNTVDAIKQCLDEILDDTKFDIDILAAPALAPCSQATEYPCTSAYEAKVYPSTFAHLNMPECGTCDVAAGSHSGVKADTAIHLIKDGKAMYWNGGLTTPDYDANNQQWYLRKCSGTTSTECLGKPDAWSATDVVLQSGDTVAWVNSATGRVYDCAHGGCSQQPFPPPSGHWGTPCTIKKADGSDGDIRPGDGVYFYGMKSSVFDPNWIWSCSDTQCGGSYSNTIASSTWTITVPQAATPTASPGAVMTVDDAITLNKDGQVVGWGGGLQAAASSNTGQEWFMRKCSKMTNTYNECLGRDGNWWPHTNGPIRSGDTIAWVNKATGQVYDCAGATCTHQRYPPPNGHWGTPFTIKKADGTDGDIRIGDAVYFYGMQGASWSTSHIIGCSQTSCGGSSSNTIASSTFTIGSP